MNRKFFQPITKAFSIEGKHGPVNFYGGSRYNLGTLGFVPSLLIVADDVDVPFIEVVSSNFSARKLLSKDMFEVNYPQIKIDWPDFEVPVGLTYDWWNSFAENLLNLPADSDVVICCQGGAGRTGTVLSLIWGLAETGDPDPVDYVRKVYKSTAVESAEQIAYIEDILNIDIESTGSMETLVTSYGFDSTEVGRGKYGNYTFGQSKPTKAWASPTPATTNPSLQTSSIQDQIMANAAAGTSPAPVVLTEIKKDKEQEEVVEEDSEEMKMIKGIIDKNFPDLSIRWYYAFKDAFVNSAAATNGPDNPTLPYITVEDKKRLWANMFEEFVKICKKEGDNKDEA